MNGQVMKWIGPAAVAAVALTVGIGDAAAQQGGLSNEQLLRLIQDQQKQIEELKAMVNKSQSDAAAQASQPAPRDGATDGDGTTLADVLKKIDIGGVVEVEVTDTEDFTGAGTSDITLSSVEVFFDTQPTDYLSTHVLLKYEDDGDEIIRLDEAWAVLGNPDMFPLYLKGGKYSVPFGEYETDMSADNLIQSVFEAGEANVLVGAAWNGFTLEGYLFNGDTQQAGDSDHIDQFGAWLHYGGEFQDVSVNLGAGYMRNVADSDGITDALGGAATMINGYVGGAIFEGSVSYMDFTFRGGYASALDNFQMAELPFGMGGAQPSAWVTEGAYTVNIMDHETIFAVTVQGTGEALALGLPELRIGGAVTVGIMEHAAITAEYLHDSDYGVSDGGTGNDGHTATLKLAVDF